MNNLLLFTGHIQKICFPEKSTYRIPASIISTITAITAPQFTTVQKALLLLAALFIADFITGIAASCIEFKSNTHQTEGAIKQYAIQSSKLRISVVKFCAYGMAILISAGIEWAFIAKEFSLHKALNQMSLTTIVVAFCCIIEAYSIVFENIKRIGFDIILQVKNIAAKGWDLYTTLKNDPK